MRNLTQLINALSSCKNWFDIAAECFFFVKRDSIPGDPRMTEESFIATYVDFDDEAPQNNPNISALCELKNGAFDLVDAYLEGILKFSKAVAELQRLMKTTELVPFENSILNTATVAWFVILAIDSRYEGTYLLSKRSPLNGNCEKTGYGIYLHCPNARIEEILASHNLSRIPSYGLVDQLSSISIVYKGDMLAFPTIKRLSYSFEQGISESDLLAPHSLSHGEHSDHNNDLNLKFGVCPFSSEKLIGSENTMPIRLERNVGSSFKITYSSESVKLFEEVVEPVMDAAIDNGCNIVIFPEMMFAPQLHEKMELYLKSKSNKGKLLLVVSGSTWDASNQSNYICLYARNGKNLGRYYKHSTYCDLGEEHKLVEGIKKPASASTLIDIPGLGRVLPAICKDVISNDSATFDLTSQLKPQITVIPAFSKSVARGFAQPLDRLAERNLVISCMANCCAARRKDRNDLGYVVCPGYTAPEQTSGKAEPCRHEICRVDCIEKCSQLKLGSCLHAIDIHYGDSENNRTFPDVSPGFIPVNWC